MRGRWWVSTWFVLSATCAPPPNFAGLKVGPRHATFEERIAVAKLPNGLRVALVPDARTNLVTVTVRYGVGGADDPPGDFGLAHYVEHLLFDAPLHGSDGADLRDVALASNAMTGADRTVFYATALDVDLDRELDIAAHRLEVTCDELDPAVLARERDVVIEEVKLRSTGQWNNDQVAAALWGPAHPYAHRPGGDTFADVTRPTLCDFIEEHYGPSSATLVVTGHLDDQAMDRIQARFASIRDRPHQARPPAPSLSAGDAKLTVPGLEKPTAMLVFPFPAEGGELDAAAEIINGMSWNLGRDAPTRFAHTFVMGGERARVIVALAEVDDASDLSDVAAAMRRVFAHPTIFDLPRLQQRARMRFVSRFDDLVAAGIRIADLYAQNQRLTRYRELSQIDSLTAPSIVRLLDGTHARVITLVPDSKTAGSHHINELATDLHNLEVSRVRDSVDLTPPPLPGQCVHRAVVDYKLPNGLTVWLAPDPDAIAIDARLVVPVGSTAGDAGKLATQAAFLLQADVGFSGMKGGWDATDRRKWYVTIGVPVTRDVGTDTTTFGVTGMALFGDWHVWNLAWTVTDGVYPEWIDRVRREKPDPPKEDDDDRQPSAISVMQRRLVGLPDDKPRDEWELFPRHQIEDYRRNTYQPGDATLIVSGKFDEPAMRKEIEALFAGWRGGEHHASQAGWNPPARAPSAAAIPVEDSATVDFAIAFAPSAASPVSESAARAVLSEIIHDRLRVVREGLGVSYGVHAHVGTEAVMVVGSVEPAYATEAAHAIVDELAKVRDGDDAFVADFVRARKVVLARAMAEPIGASQRANELERIAIAHASFDQPDKDLEAIRTLDIGDVRRLAARDLRPDRMIVAVRGPDDAVNAAMGALGVSAKIDRILSKKKAK